MHGSFIKGYLVNSNKCLMKSNWWAKTGQKKQNPSSKQNVLREVRRAESSLCCSLETELWPLLSSCWEVDLVTGPCAGSAEDHGAPGNQATGPEEKVSRTQAGGCVGSVVWPRCQTPQAAGGNLPPVWPSPTQNVLFSQNISFHKRLFSWTLFFQD